VKALGDSVERADDRDIEEEARSNDAADPDERKQRDVHSELGDAQDIPDTARANDAKAKADEEAKAIAKAPANR
jgi:hypothetical protein